MISEDLRQKVITAFEGDFVGDVIFDDEELEKIQDFVTSVFSSVGSVSTSSYLFYECLTVLIISKSRNYGEDSDDMEENHYWADVFGEIFKDETLMPYNNPKLKVDDFFAQHGKTWLRDAKGRTRRFKQTFLYNSFAPKYSLEAFVELVFDAYTNKENVTTGFFDDPYEFDSKPYLSFVNDFSNKLNGYKDLEENVCLYNKWYHLSAAMRHGFSQDQEKMAKLVSRTVNYIRNYFLKEPIFDNSYFSILVNNYLTKEKIKNNINVSVQKIEKVRSILDWYAYYSWNVNEGRDARLYIKMPLLKLESINQYSGLVLYLSVGNKVVETKQLDIVGYDYNPHINPILIDVTRYLKQTGKELDFKIEIFTSDFDEPIFSTDYKSSLVRPFLLFTNSSERENKEEIINPNFYNSILVIVPAGLINDFINSDTFDEAYLVKDNAYRLTPKTNEYLSFGDKTVFFVDSAKEARIKIDGNKMDRISFESISGTKYESYNGIENITISVSKDYFTNTDEYEIIITNISNNQNKLIRKYSLLLNNEIRKNGIFISSENYECINHYGINIIEIVRCSDSKTVTKFSYFNANFQVIFDETNITKNGLVNLCLLRDGEEVLCDNYRISDKNVYYQLDFGTVVVKLPYICVTFEGCKNDDPLYLAEDTRVKNIYSPKDGTGDILSLPLSKIHIDNFSDIDFKLMIDNKEVGSNGCDYLVGKILNDLLFTQATIKFVYKKKSDGSTREIPLYKIFSKEYVDSNGLSIVYDEGVFYYQINGFVGETNPTFKIKIYDDECSTEEEPLIIEPEILEGLSGTFLIKDFEEGYYNASLVRVAYEFIEYKEKAVLLRKESENFAFAFGDPIKTQYNNSSFALTKVIDLCKKNEMKEYYIKNVKFKTYGIFPIFTGILTLGNKKIMDIEFALKNESNFVLYSDYDSGKRLLMNKNTKEITGTETAETFEIRSVYVEEM